MGRSSDQGRLATRFTHPRLSTDAGTIFVPPYPLDLERHFGGGSAREAAGDPSLTAFEQLVDAARYQLVLSLSWGRGSASAQTLDLGLLRADGDKLFVVHQLNDDAGTSLILAYLAAEVPIRLFRLFLVDYLTSRGTGYMVTLPCLLPESIWIVQPEVVSHAAVATGLLGLVTPGGVDWSYAQLGAGASEQHAPHVPQRASQVA